MTPHLDDGDVRVYHGDCIEVMAAMDASSVDVVVTDPPYALEFMGHGWDRFTPAEFQAWCEAWGREALRVLKPGGHLLAFGGTRTSHRLMCGLEDAGFEIRDTLAWLYGSGFPKSLDVSKAIDKAAGAEREVVGPGTRHGVGNGSSYELPPDVPDVTAPATPEAARWQGWGTALKPAHEPIVLARKPLTGTVAGNVLEHRTGALNIDGCRIPHANAADLESHRAMVEGIKNRGGSMGNSSKNSSDLAGANDVKTAGRWPANVVLDEEAAAMLDEQAGERPSAGKYNKPQNGKNMTSKQPTSWSIPPQEYSNAYAGDTGGASRFFYTAKADAQERRGSKHPTVKPLDLMRWLVRLATPPGGVVLDPFAGSGTTLEAARAEGHRAIGIEREAEYLPDIAARLAQLSLLGGD